jgi:uncharacterized protein (DUF427 family)
MSLTAGSGPFGSRPAGRFNFPPPPVPVVLYIEPVLPGIRGVAQGETVVDSPNAQLLHEQGRLPVYHFPADEVRTELLHESGEREDTPRGTVAWHDLRIGDRVEPRAAWTYAEPEPSAPWLAGLVAFRWSALDEWFAEAEPLHGHPRDPFSRIDVCRTTRHVRVSLDGHELASSRRGRILFEAGLPPRYYLPPDDVRMDLLEPTDFSTTCPFKGDASYWTLRIGDETLTGIAWSYQEPLEHRADITGLICFYADRVDEHTVEPV